LQNQAATFQHLKLATAAGTTSELRVTPEHPFWVIETGECVAAKNLESGMSLVTPEGARVTVVECHQETQSTRESVFNLTIGDAHTYFVLPPETDTPVLVHNECKVRNKGGVSVDEPSHSRSASAAPDRAQTPPQGASQVGTGKQPITDPSRLLPAPQRPNWEQSEIDVAADFPGWRTQQSYKQGRPARYGADGSVRPDLSHPTLPMHFDVKNYDLTSSGNRYNLYRELARQAESRAGNLPSGSVQGVVLDIRGQSIDPAVLQRIPANIEQVTNGRIKAQDVIFKTR